MSEALIKAIPTRFDGHTFRSKLEAQWAVFFKEAHIKYDYEPEGFEQENGTRYLPDFYLPDQKIWAEVKPDRPNAFEELKRAISFVKEDGLHRLLILPNIPPEREDGLAIWWLPYIVYDTVFDEPKLIRAFFALHGENGDEAWVNAEWRPAEADCMCINEWVYADAAKDQSHKLAHRLTHVTHDFDMPYQEQMPYDFSDWFKRHNGIYHIAEAISEDAQQLSKYFDMARNYKFDHRGGGSK